MNGSRGESDTRQRGGASDDLDIPLVLAQLDATDPATRGDAVETVYSTVDDTPAACAPTIPKLKGLLERSDLECHESERVLYCLAELAGESPTDVAPSAGTIASFAADTDSLRARREALRCLATVADMCPNPLIDHVEDVLEALDGDAASDDCPTEWELTVLSRLSRDVPGEISPAVPVLVDALEAAPTRNGPIVCPILTRVIRADSDSELSLEFVETMQTIGRTGDETIREDVLECLETVVRYYPDAIEESYPGVLELLEGDGCGNGNDEGTRCPDNQLA